MEALRNSADGFDIEASIVHADGVCELYLGQVRGPRIDLATDAVVRAAGAKDYLAATRMCTASSTGTCCGRGTSRPSAPSWDRTRRRACRKCSDALALRRAARGRRPRGRAGARPLRQPARRAAPPRAGCRDRAPRRPPRAHAHRPRSSRLADSIRSQELKSLQPGVSTETLILDPQGHIEHQANLVDDGERLWLIVDQDDAEPLQAWLTRMRFRMQVEIADVTDEFAKGAVDRTGGAGGVRSSRVRCCVRWPAGDGAAAAQRHHRVYIPKG